MHADPQYEPSDDDLAKLSQILGMPGFEVLIKIGWSECARFDVRTKNLDPEGQKDNYDRLVLEYHRQAKVASMVWQGIVDRIARAKLVLDQPKEKGQRPTDADAMADITAALD